MIFQCACQDFPHWRIVVRHSSQKIQNPPTTILLLTPFLGLQKTQIVKTILYPMFLPMSVKTLPKQKFQLHLNVQFLSSS